MGCAALLTLVERKTRKLIIRKIKDKTQASVLRAINGIERSMGKEAFKVMFVSMTADNGSEFLDYLALEQSVTGQSSRTHIYYAHPYSSWERGTNENTNRIIRRFVPKGCDIGKYTRKELREIEAWINGYLPVRSSILKPQKNGSLWSWHHERSVIIKSWAF